MVATLLAGLACPWPEVFASAHYKRTSAAAFVTAVTQPAHFGACGVLPWLDDQAALAGGSASTE
jgi:hypothetical protein